MIIAVQYKQQRQARHADDQIDHAGIEQAGAARGWEGGWSLGAKSVAIDLHAIIRSFPPKRGPRDHLSTCSCRLDSRLRGNAW